jgi:protein-tyrosine phosphatase
MRGVLMVLILDYSNPHVPRRQRSLALGIKAMTVDAHQLFNDITNSNPSFFLDLRSTESFARCHLRGAGQLSEADCLNIDAVSGKMKHLREHNKISLIYLTDNATNMEIVCKALQCANQWREQAAALSLEVDTDSRWKNIMSVSQINFDTFFAAYPRCSSLYIGSAFPTKKEAIPGKLYPSDIMPQFLYLGNFYDANNKVELQELGITHIVDVTSEMLSFESAQQLGLTYLSIPIWDMEGVNIAEHFEKVLGFIDDARATGGRVLVHCRAGISRSATFVLAYMLHSGYAPTLRDALRMVMDQRPYVLPNPSFREQLLEFEMSRVSARSFECEKDMVAYMSTMNFCWSGLFALETDHDKIPIITATRRIDYNKVAEQYDGSLAGAADNVPKKPFLKRGEKRAAVKQPLPEGSAPSVAPATESAAAPDSSAPVPNPNSAAKVTKQPSLRERIALQKTEKQHTPHDSGGLAVAVPCAGSGAAAVKVRRVSDPSADSVEAAEAPAGDGAVGYVPHAPSVAVHTALSTMSEGDGGDGTVMPPTAVEEEQRA